MNLKFKHRVGGFTLFLARKRNPSELGNASKNVPGSASTKQMDEKSNLLGSPFVFQNTKIMSPFNLINFVAMIITFVPVKLVSPILSPFGPRIA